MIRLDLHCQLKLVYIIFLSNTDKLNSLKSLPSVFFKIVFIQYLFGIRSMRQTIREIGVNVAYRWFIGYDLFEKIPHFSTFGKNYSRRFQGTDIFERVFLRILEKAVKCGFVDASAIFIDGTHIKANANKRKNTKEEI